MYKRLILQGGGVKGIALVGALKVLCDKNIKFENVVGCSAGAIVGSLFSAGYTPDEIREILLDLEFGRILDGGIGSFIFGLRKGIYRGTKFTKWLQDLLKKKSVSKFNDIHANSGISLEIVATDITKRKPILFPFDFPDVTVADAVRMSVGIPFVFDPVPLASSEIVDGGVFSNFPLSLVPSEGDSVTLGLRLSSSGGINRGKPKRLTAYIHQIIGTMLDSHDSVEVESRSIDIVKIDTGDVSSTDFHLSRDEKQRLFEAGQLACLEQLAHRVDNAARVRVRSEPASIQYMMPLEAMNTKGLRVRCSMSGLIKISCDNKYLLIRSQRRPGMFQPVGGVFKYNRAGEVFLNEIDARSDTSISVDEDNRGDLRVAIPLDRLNEFLKWYLSRKGREVSPLREFCEEAFDVGGLKSELFQRPHFEWSHTRGEGLRWNRGFKCWELLVADVFELEASEAQVSALREHCDEIQRNGSENFAWVTEDDIRRGGWRENAVRLDRQISEHSEWIFDYR